MADITRSRKHSAIAVKLILAASAVVHAISIAIQIYYFNLFGSTVGIPQLISYGVLFLVEVLPAGLAFVGAVIEEGRSERGNVPLALACLYVSISSLYGLALSFKNGVTVLNWSYIVCQAVISAAYIFIAVDGFRAFKLLNVSRVLGAIPILVGVVRLCSSGLSILDRLVFSPEMLVGLAVVQTWGMLAELLFYVAVFVFLIVNAKPVHDKNAA